MQNRLSVIFEGKYPFGSHTPIYIYHSIGRIPDHGYRQICKAHFRCTNHAIFKDTTGYRLLKKTQFLVFSKLAIEELSEHGINLIITQIPIPDRMYSIRSHSGLPPHILELHLSHFRVAFCQFSHNIQRFQKIPAVPK